MSTECGAIPLARILGYVKSKGGLRKSIHHRQGVASCLRVLLLWLLHYDGLEPQIINQNEFLYLKLVLSKYVFKMSYLLFTPVFNCFMWWLKKERHNKWVIISKLVWVFMILSVEKLASFKLGLGLDSGGWDKSIRQRHKTDVSKVTRCHL